MPNNITPLGSVGNGKVGMDSSIESDAGRMINEIISENNLRSKLNNPRYRNLVDALTRVISKWLPNDKIRLLREYGNTSTLDAKKMTGSALDEHLAITLISRLPINELEKIVGKEEKGDQQLLKDVSVATSKAKQFASRLSTQMTKNVEQNLRESTQNVNSAKDFNKALDNTTGSKGKKSNNGFYIDKYTKEAIAGLRKEVTIVLKTTYSHGDLAKLINVLDIDNDEGSTSIDTLVKRCTNAISCWVALALGKEKGIHASAFSFEAITAIEKVLKLTSFGWVTGKVGANDMSLMSKRNAAQKALRLQTAAQKNLEAKNKIGVREGSKALTDSKTGQAKIKKGKVKIGDKKYADFKPLGQYTRGELAPIYDRQFKNLLKTLLGKDADNFDEYINDPEKYSAGKEKIVKLAIAQGIVDAETADVRRLVVQMAQIAASQEYSMIDSLKKVLGNKKSTAEDKLNAVNEYKERQGASLYGGLLKDRYSRTQETSNSTPIITFNNKGELTSEVVNMAVPVWVINNSSQKIGPGSTGLTAKDIKTRKDSDNLEATLELEKEFRALMGEVEGVEGNKKLQKTLEKSSRRDEKRNRKLVGVTSTTDLLESLGLHKTADATTPTTAPVTAQPILPQVIPGYSVQPAQVSGVTPQIPKNLKQIETDLKRESHVSHRYLNNKLDEKEINSKKKLLVQNLRKVVSADIGMKVFKQSEINRTAQVMPVLDLNKSHEDVDVIRRAVIDISDAENAILGTVAQIPTLFGTLQQGGTSFNMAATSTVLGNVMAAVNAASVEAAKNLGGTSAMATGGRVAPRHNVSSVITGDARRGTNNKANPELVSVDWSRKQIDVKPIPALATGGAAAKPVNNTTVTSRMTSGERNKPLTVGIGSGLITYTKQLTDVQDDGSKSAVKVYSINSGIHEKIKIGEAQVSLFDAVYGILGTLGNLQTAIAANTQVLSTIATEAASINKNIISSSAKTSSAPFSFPTELDEVLQGR